MVKYIGYGLVLGVAAILGMAFQKTETNDDIQPIAVVQVKCAWQQVAVIADPNVSFGVDDRRFSDIVEVANSSRGKATYSEQDAVDTDPNWVVWKVPTDARNVQFAAVVDADGDDAVVELWGCAGRYIGGTTTSGSFQLGTTITWKGGTQVGPGSNVYCDTATTSDSTLVSLVEDSGNNRIVTVTVNVEGMDVIAFLGTTVDTNVTILARWGN